MGVTAFGVLGIEGVGGVSALGFRLTGETGCGSGVVRVRRCCRRLCTASLQGSDGEVRLRRITRARSACGSCRLEPPCMCSVENDRCALLPKGVLDDERGVLLLSSVLVRLLRALLWGAASWCAVACGSTTTVRLQPDTLPRLMCTLGIGGELSSGRQRCLVSRGDSCERWWTAPAMRSLVSQRTRLEGSVLMVCSRCVRCACVQQR